MFQISDVVVYGSQGVCEIVGIDEKKLDGTVKKYFVLKPKNDREATFYVPTWNENAWGKMRKVLTKAEVDAFIDMIPNNAPTWIDNENERKELYKKILTSGDQVAVISMIQALFLHKQEREAVGKRLHMSDAHFLKDAEALLYNEWQYVLDLDKASLMDYILSRIDKK